MSITKEKPTAARIAANRMSREDAAEGSVELAYKIQDSLAILDNGADNQKDGWRRWIDSLPKSHPWTLLPEPDGSKDFWAWLAIARGDTKEQFETFLKGVGGEELVCRLRKALTEANQLVSLGRGGKREGAGGYNQHKLKEDQSYPGNFDPQPKPGSRGRGNSATYLRDRLSQEFPEEYAKVEQEGGYRSLQSCAVAVGILPKRNRYEISDAVNLDNAAKRITEVLGPERTSELVAKLLESIS